MAELRLRLGPTSEIRVWGLGDSGCGPLVCREDEKVNVCEWFIKCCFKKKVLGDFTSVGRLWPRAHPVVFSVRA